MNRVVVKLLIVFLIWSCNSQESIEREVQGNWQIFADSSNEEMIYLEVFFDENHYTVYDEKVGQYPRIEYFISDNELILKNISSGESENVGKITIKNDLLFITNNNRKLTYKKLGDNISLGNLKGDKIGHEKFAKAFYKRLLIWEQEIENR